MYLRRLLLRFYKSFNFDYLRKNDRRSAAGALPWEQVEGAWYPFVSVPLHPQVTTVVGANESGKSHLLTGIEKAVSGRGIEREDFCRYSRFFSVGEARMRHPDFGLEWAGLTADERRRLAQLCRLGKGARVPDHFLVLRPNQARPVIYLGSTSGYSKYSIHDEQSLADFMPATLRLQEKVALPESVPLGYLAGERVGGSPIPIGRGRRFDIHDGLLDNAAWFESAEAVAKSAQSIAELLRGTRRSNADLEVKGYQLAWDLVRTVAGVDGQAFHELQAAIRKGKDAFANALTADINHELRKALNFPAWWAQDRDFQLMVTPREHDLVFTVKDRTGSEYSVDERSSGLRYFLSYYVQYLVHERSERRSVVLLMDEPDAFLSNQGQQDLLRIFSGFANPTNKLRPPTQVVYVTHSPFLVDRNHADRIRVLDKGVGDEGTRVVDDASRNHYEPLRSALGSFVAETAFIGHCNLLVEGVSDQILIAGACSILAASGASSLERLDLNTVTIVPAGGAPNVPYLAYLARGRDVEKPAVVVLLDSDDAGNEARKGLQRGGAYRKELVKGGLILQVGELAEELGLKVPPTAIEDLIPAGLCVAALRRYLQEFLGEESLVEGVTESVVDEAVSAERSVFLGAAAVLQVLGSDLRIEKVGFARSVIDAATELSMASGPRSESLVAFERNMKVLLRELESRRRTAERDLGQERLANRLRRIETAFLQDYPESALRESAVVLLENIEAALDSSAEAEEIRAGLRGLRRDFDLDSSPTEPVERFPEFRNALEGLRYLGRLAAPKLPYPGAERAAVTQESARESGEKDAAEVPASKARRARAGGLGRSRAGQPRQRKEAVKPRGPAA